MVLRWGKPLHILIVQVEENLKDVFGKIEHKVRGAAANQRLVEQLRSAADGSRGETGCAKSRGETGCAKQIRYNEGEGE